MVGLELLIEIEPGRRAEFLQMFDMVKLVNHTKGKRLDLKLYQQLNSQNCLLWRENWEDAESLELYHSDIQVKAMLGAIDILGKRK